MARTKLHGIPIARAALKKHLLGFTQEVHVEISMGAKILTKAFLMRTPVWSGETVVNYVWGRGRANLKKRSSLGTWRGSNVGVPLGGEANRGANEAVVMGNLTATFQFKGKNSIPKKYVFVNNIDPVKWDLINMGAAPNKQAARNPGGVTRLAMQKAMAQLNSNIWKRGSG